MEPKSVLITTIILFYKNNYVQIISFHSLKTKKSTHKRDAFLIVRTRIRPAKVVGIRSTLTSWSIKAS
jgi:hypothetical protein